MKFFREEKRFKKKLTSLKRGGILINVAAERQTKKLFKTVDFDEMK